MKCIRNRNKLDFGKELSLPKDFEFKILGTLLMDLESTVDESFFDPALVETLKADFKLARRLIRKRDVEAICQLGSSLSTQCMLGGRTIHSKGDAEAFFLQYQLGAFLKKYPFKGVDTRRPAIQKFMDAERQCAMFNTSNYQALLRLDSTCHQIYGNMLDEIRGDVEKLLGALPQSDRVEVSATHGPGVAVGTGYEKGQTTSYYKWSNLPYTVTAAALPYAKRAISSDPRWIGALDHWYRSRSGNRYAPIDVNDFWSRVFRVVSGSRITTVPKTALTDRTIAIEPMMNGYMQLGVNQIMRRRLKKCWNMDLLSQKLNQTLAEEGAKNGTYATIDLSAASDTISLKVCELLLPPAWYGFLLDLRSPKGTLDGFEGSFDKMSSMGNGFTFALETIVFGAITRHVMRRLKIQSTIAIYGDDIVVPTQSAEVLIDLLQLFGFTINKEKSFINGPFRESCGSDWFFEYDVRPVFLTRRVDNVLDLFYIHNSLYQLERKLCWHWGIHFKHTRKFIRSYIPERYKHIYGPPSETLDGYLFSDRKIPGVGQHRWHLTINAKAVTFNRQSDFFFRKLMAPLKGSDQARFSVWDRRRQLTTGNSFDITRRDAVQYICTKKAVYY